MKLFAFLRRRQQVSPGVNVPDIEAEASKYRWYHCIDLAPGYTTPGIVGLSEHTPGWEQRYLFPTCAELRGKSVLDIGTMNGFFAFQAEKRGASRVVAIDRDPVGFPDTREAFNFAAKMLESRVIYRVRSVYELEPTDFTMFDFVLMYGVLYHLKFPFYGLYRAASVCRDIFLLETHVTLKDDYERPLMLFYPQDELNNDRSNWWGPNPRCVDALMEHLGFVIEQRAIQEQEVPGLAPARYVVSCRRVRPSPAPFSDL